MTGICYFEIVLNKKLNIILIIPVIIMFLLPGNFYSFGYCESQECCKTECCEENSSYEHSDLKMTISSKDCCEYNQSTANITPQALSINPNTTIQNILITSSSLQNEIPDNCECNHNLKKSFGFHTRKSHSISVLRI